MSTQHTPGPWRLDDDIIRDTKGRCLLDACDANMALEDARLIAAAPELLEAMKDLAQSIVWKEFGECRGFSNSVLLTVITAVEKARAAIAKAEGGAA